MKNESLIIWTWLCQWSGFSLFIVSLHIFNPHNVFLHFYTHISGLLALVYTHTYQVCWLCQCLVFVVNKFLYKWWCCCCFFYLFLYFFFRMLSYLRNTLEMWWGLGILAGSDVFFVLDYILVPINLNFLLFLGGTRDCLLFVQTKETHNLLKFPCHNREDRWWWRVDREGDHQGWKKLWCD